MGIFSCKFSYLLLFRPGALCIHNYERASYADVYALGLFFRFLSVKISSKIAILM